MTRLYEILEYSDNDSLKNVGFEDSNNLQIGVSSIEKISVYTTSSAIKVMNIYSIVTTEDYSNKDIFYVGQVCTMCYDDKLSLLIKDNTRNNYKFSIASIKEENGKIKLSVTTKDVLEMTDKCHIETNADLISSQYVNQKWPKNIILTEVGDGSVVIKFTSNVSEYEGFIVAYRKADDNNIVWNFIQTDEEQCKIENVEEEVYKVRVMYFNGTEYSLFSPEVEMKFYL